MAKNENGKRSLHIIPKLLCVFFAFVIWLYVMEVDSPDYEADFNDVAVSFTGTSTLETNYNLSVFSGYDSTVDVTVKGQKSVIGKYTSDTLSVTADVSDITESGNYTVDLFFDLPSGLTLSSASTTSVNLYIDTRATATVQVKSKLASVTIPDNCELGELAPDTESVTVTGPESVLGEIDYALVSLDAGAINTSVTMIGQLSLINLSGDIITNPYVKLSKSEVKVGVPLITSKEISLAVDYKYGYFTDKNSEVSISPETVVVKGDPSTLETLDSITISTINEKSIVDDSSRIVNIELPDGITLADGQPTTASVSIKRLDAAKKVFNISSITLENTGDLSCDVLTKSISVTVVGNAAAVSSLTASDISVSVDMSGYTDSRPGILYAAANVTVNSSDDSAYELGEYSVQVQIS